MAGPAPDPPIPAPLWEKLDAFFQARASGTVTLQIKEGTVRAYEITEKGVIRTGPEPRHA